MPFPLPGAGASTSGPAATDELSARAALPPVAGFSLGDAINVGGTLWRLAAGTADPHVHHGRLTSGSAAAGTPDAGYVGDTTFSFDDNPPGNVRFWVPTALATEATLFVEYHRGPAWDELELVRTASVVGGRTRYGLAPAEANRLDYDFESGYVGDGFTVSAYSDAARQNAVRIVANANRWVLVVDPSKMGGDADTGSTGSTDTPALATVDVTAASGAAGSAVNRKFVVADAGKVVESPWSAIDLVEDATPQEGMTVVANEMVFANAARLTLAGTFTTQADGSGGSARSYPGFRAKRVRGAVTTYPKLAVANGYRKSTSSGAADLSQGPRKQVTGFSWELDVEAGDKLSLEWEAFLQTSAQIDILSAESGLAVRVWPTSIAGGAGGGGQGQQSPGAGVHVGDDPPASPAEGALWSDTSAGNALKRYDGAAWVAVATVPELNNAVAGLALTIQGGIEQVIRRATFARAWIRAGTEAAALAGTGAATWTNSGPGTPPTGAHWRLSDVPAGAGHVYELTAQVSPTPGHGTAWTFGTWAALQVTALNTQYSVDGSTRWHTPRVQADRYERHFTGGAWGPAIPLYAADELVWANLISTDIYHATTHWLPPIALIDLPARMLFNSLNLMRIRMETRVAGGRVVAGDAVVNPDFFLAAPYADRATATPQPEFYWQIRLNAAGLSAITGGLHHGNGPAANGEDAGLTLQWIRPPSPSHAGEAASLRVVYLKNLRTTYRLMIEAL